jgi:hypothetical protein
MTWLTGVIRKIEVQLQSNELAGIMWPLGIIDECIDG